MSPTSTTNTPSLATHIRNPKQQKTCPTFKPPKNLIHPETLPTAQQHTPRHTTPTPQSYPPLYTTLTPTDTQCYTDGSCMKIDGDTALGAAFVIINPTTSETTTHLVDPNGAAETNTINRAELSALHLALQHACDNNLPTIYLYTDSLCSLYQIQKTLHTPHLMRLSKHYDLLKNITNLIHKRALQHQHTYLSKVKSHIGIQGNELADQAAVRMAKQQPLPTDQMYTDPPPHNPIHQKKAPTPTFPISKQDTEKARTAIHIALAQNAPTLLQKTTSTLQAALAALNGDHTPANLARIRKTHPILLTPILKELNLCLQQATKAFLDTVPCKPPCKGRRFLSSKLGQQHRALHNTQRHIKYALSIAQNQPAQTLQDTLTQPQNTPCLATLTQHDLAPPMTNEEIPEWQQKMNEKLQETKKTFTGLRAASEKESNNKHRLQFQHLLSTRPRTAHRSIFRDPSEEARAALKAIKDPITGLTHRTGPGILSALHTYFTNLMTLAFGPKHGQYMPEESPRNYPWEQPQATDPYFLTSLAKDQQNNTSLLTNIMEKNALTRTITKLPKAKAPGPDGVHNAVLQMLPAEMVDSIHQLFILMWIHGTTPDTWKDSHTFLLYKA